MSEAITERVVEFIARSPKVPSGQITLDAAFAELGMSSLDALSLITDLEEEFNIEIPHDEVMGLRNVRQVVESIRRQLSETGALADEAGDLRESS